MILISKDLVLSTTFVLDPYNPLIGWKNVVTFNGLSAAEEDPNNPVTNLANPSTANWYQSTETVDEHFIQFDFSPTEVMDYAAFADHNFGSAGIRVRIEAKIAAGDYEVIFNNQNLDTDSPHMFIFQSGLYNSFRIYFLPQSGIAPRAAVMYIGKLMAMPVGVPVGHTPIVDGSVVRSTSNVSEGGQFLGKIVLSETLQNSIEFQDIDSDWYRTYMRPFVEHTKEYPFFIAAFPVDYPEEVGFVWTTNTPRPTISRETGYMSVSLSMAGIA